jgi:polysaccharide export outer membrane protein
MERFLKWVAGCALALATGIAAAAEAPLAAGDMVRLSVHGNPDLSIETRISEAGTIIVPLIGQIHIGGMPIAAAEKKIGGALESGGYIKKAQVNMVVTALQSQQVAVLGHVNRPGLYALEGRRSVLEVLAMAGGTAAEGGDTVSLVRSRDGSVTRDTIDIVQMVQSGQLDRNVAVGGGDLIYVEPAPRFYIMGQVQRPGAFRVERGMTVLQALAAGGGLTPRGTDRGIRITRRDASGNLTVTEARHDDTVQSGDVITVRGSWF